MRAADVDRPQSACVLSGVRRPSSPSRHSNGRPHRRDPSDGRQVGVPAIVRAGRRDPHKSSVTLRRCAGRRRNLHGSPRPRRTELVERQDRLEPPVPHDGRHDLRGEAAIRLEHGAGRRDRRTRRRCRPARPGRPRCTSSTTGWLGRCTVGLFADRLDPRGRGTSSTTGNGGPPGRSRRSVTRLARVVSSRSWSAASSGDIAAIIEPPGRDMLASWRSTVCEGGHDRRGRRAGGRRAGEAPDADGRCGRRRREPVRRQVRRRSRAADRPLLRAARRVADRARPRAPRPRRRRASARARSSASTATSSTARR